MILLQVQHAIRNIIGGRVAFVAAMIAIVLLGATDRANASCGDYLQSHALKNVGSMIGHASAHSASLPVHPRQCDSPNCRSQLPFSQPTPPASPVARPDELAVYVSELNTSLSSAMAGLSSLAAEPNDGYPSSLKRPPRLAP